MDQAKAEKSASNTAVDDFSDDVDGVNFTKVTTPVRNPNLQNQDYLDSRFKEYVFVGFCMLSQLLNQAAMTQANPMFNVISRDMHSGVSQQTWLMAAFPLVSGSFILISGKIGDIYGLKKTLIAGYITVIIWSSICGLSSYAHNVNFFIVSRAFQGLGIAFILPNVMGTVGNIYVPNTKAKNMIFSLIGACAPIGATLGCVFSGLIAQESKVWAWAFYAYTITAALNLCVAVWIIPNNIPTNIHKFKMDWWGAALGVAGLILLNFVWNQAPIDGWNKAYIIVLLVVSLIVLVAFFLFEVKVAKEPLLPRAVMHNRRILMILASLFLGWGSFGIWTFYYMCFVLNLRHYSPLWAGGTYFMFVIWGIVAALLVGYTLHICGPAVLLFISMIAFDCGCIMLAVTPVNQTYFRMTLGIMTILSFGMDLSFPASSIILSDELPSQYQGMAGSLVSTMVSYSSSMCLGIGTTAEHYVNKSGTELLEGYRAALYVGIGLSSLAVINSGIYMIEEWWLKRKERLAKDLKNSTLLE
ncbi:LAME_0G13322g1_1 [Lachancea meyersii CBS 8951]|uniref:LAME_0G13322g1_1 n=1 Tax=Lachancea meyersii CBS 8951 TaxID=1266667 RepID=A0A1G4KA21_9SACH|nr:LAME_0G13322g1_1 [Lachancea meyersii CBS 8951]